MQNQNILQSHAPRVGGNKPRGVMWIASTLGTERNAGSPFPQSNGQ